MDWFIHQQNLELFRRVLAHPVDEAQRAQVLKLLAEEEAKTRDKPPPPRADEEAA
jgi:hypothetical protein